MNIQETFLARKEWNEKNCRKGSMTYDYHQMSVRMMRIKNTMEIRTVS